MFGGGLEYYQADESDGRLRRPQLIGTVILSFNRKSEIT